MTLRDRLSSGAEHVLQQIWTTLQDRNGIHAASLMTCLGALAGHASQVSARESGDAVNVPLIDDRVSVWALVRKALQKLGRPAPDLAPIIEHVSQVAAIRTFVPRAPVGVCPHLSAMAYLKYLWPRVLPIVERHCEKPAQWPVLFGIALHRAIERTKDDIDPTAAASMAMQCALAMSKAELPGAQGAPKGSQKAAAAPAATNVVPIEAPGRARNSAPMWPVTARTATPSVSDATEKNLPGPSSTAPRTAATGSVTAEQLAAAAAVVVDRSATVDPVAASRPAAAPSIEAALFAVTSSTTTAPSAARAAAPERTPRTTSPVRPSPVHRRNPPRVGERSFGLRIRELIVRLPPSAHIAAIASLAFVVTAAVTLQADRRETRAIINPRPTLASLQVQSNASAPELRGPPPVLAIVENDPAAYAPPVDEEPRPEPEVTTTADAEDEALDEPSMELFPPQPEYDASLEGVMFDAYGQPVT